MSDRSIQDLADMLQLTDASDTFWLLILFAVVVGMILLAWPEKRK